MADSETRPTIEVKAAAGGWPHPWPNVAELARVLPSDRWTLIGGLMTQLHAVHHRIDAVRPTNDVDIVLHIETARGTPNLTADALERLGYTLKENVDVVVADHPAPSVEERMHRMDLVKIPGGTQALKRTVNYRLEIEEGAITGTSLTQQSFSPASTIRSPNARASQAQTAHDCWP